MPFLSDDKIVTTRYQEEKKCSPSNYARYPSNKRQARDGPLKFFQKSDSTSLYDCINGSGFPKLEKTDKNPSREIKTTEISSSTAQSNIKHVLNLRSFKKEVTEKLTCIFVLFQVL